MSTAYRRLPFAEQIRFFRGKLNIPTQSYADIYGAEHDAAFVVAGMARMDMLADMRKAVDKAIADGTTLDAFRNDFDDIVARYGWQYHGGRDWRSRIIYNTNLYSSYQAGRYEQQQEMKPLRPYWEYRHRDGQKHPRPEHEAWDGLVLHADDPWWQTHYPVNAYGCKCTVFAHSKRSLERNGLKVGKAPPVELHTVTIGKNSANPRIVAVPKGIDPGFDHVPGKARDSMLQRLFDKASNVPPELASSAVSATLAHPHIKDILRKEVAEMVDNAFAMHAKRQEMERQGKKGKIGEVGIKKSIGVIAPDIIAELTRRQVAPKTAVITLRDTDIFHLRRASKHQPISQAAWRNIVDYINDPAEIRLDISETPHALLYIVEADGIPGKIVLKMDYDIKNVKDKEGKRRTIVGNIIRSGMQLLTPEEIASLNRHEALYKKK